MVVAVAVKQPPLCSNPGIWGSGLGFRVWGLDRVDRRGKGGGDAREAWAPRARDICGE